MTAEIRPIVGILEFVSINILASLSRSEKENQIFIIFTNRKTKLTRAASTVNITSIQVAHMFLNDHVVQHVTPDIILWDSRQKLIGRSLKSLCTYLNVKNLTTTVFHHQINE